MKKKFLLSVILIPVIFSCNNSPLENNNKQETPKALEDKSSSYELVSKRGYEDLIENLYNELLTKDNDLKRFDKMISELDQTKNDSTAAFDKFNQKNLAYYASATTHLSYITDSLLKKKIQTLIESSKSKYTSFTSQHFQLIKIIEEKELSINDIHNVLKIVQTLPMIEKYQKDKAILLGASLYER